MWFGAVVLISGKAENHLWDFFLCIFFPFLQLEQCCNGSTVLSWLAPVAWVTQQSLVWGSSWYAFSPSCDFLELHLLLHLLPHLLPWNWSSHALASLINCNRECCLVMTSWIEQAGLCNLKCASSSAVLKLSQHPGTCHRWSSPCNGHWWYGWGTLGHSAWCTHKWDNMTLVVYACLWPLQAKRSECVQAHDMNAVPVTIPMAWWCPLQRQQWYTASIGISLGSRDS